MLLIDNNTWYASSNQVLLAALELVCGIVCVIVVKVSDNNANIYDKR